MKILFFILLIASHFTLNAKTFNHCNQFLNLSNDPEFDYTSNLISYLTRMHSEGVLEIKDLAKIKAHLESQKTLLNPFHSQVIAQSKEIYHSEILQTYVDNIEKINQKALLAWLDQYLKSHNKIDDERNKTQKETATIVIPFHFHLVEVDRAYTFSAGQFVKLPADFLMMDIPVTQAMWLNEMKENPSHFQGDLNLPVENITWWAAAEFANRWSKAEGLPEVYDFSKVHFKPGTRAEDGTLEALSGELKINAPDEDIYKSAGYRLPTELEQIYVRSGAGLSTDDHFPGIIETGWPGSNILDYGWTAENAGDRTHPVGLKLPFVIQGNEFYDLYGNVQEWAHDYVKFDAPFAKANLTVGFGVTTRGAGYKSSAMFNSHTRFPKSGPCSPNWHSSMAGLRLVRNIPR